MRFPVNGFGPGKGITPDQAACHHADTVQYIQNRLSAIKQGMAELEQVL
jgi:hypothetical protein